MIKKILYWVPTIAYLLLIFFLLNSHLMKLNGEGNSFVSLANEIKGKNKIRKDINKNLSDRFIAFIFFGCLTLASVAGREAR